jgi:hypothetical protein
MQSTLNPSSKQPAGLVNRAEALLAQQAEQLAAAEARLQQLEAVTGICSCSSSSSSSSIRSSSVNPPQHQPQKRARSAVHLAQALDEDEVLDETFSFVGRKEWLYVGGVCRRWRGRYLSMCYTARTSKKAHAFQTSSRSSFVTAARFSLALENKLTMPDKSDESGDFFDDLPLLSTQPIEVLTLARVRGAPWHEDMCIDAAYYGNFELLKWLHTSGCPWNPFNVAVHAVRGKRGERQHILPWLLSIVEERSQKDKKKLLLEAGSAYSIASLQLMLDAGAHWPSSFFGEKRAGTSSLRVCWNFRAVAWALDNGCTWGAWRCQDCAPELYTEPQSDKYNEQNAVGLFEWAHENGCPCTCEAAAADSAVVAA